jgi:D-aminopeptidase
VPQQRPRARDLGITLGSLPPGPLNTITDVAGVRVGHATIARDQPDGGRPLRTGVTAILPHGGNVFTRKVPAAFHVINGFGKATGSTQIQELGVLETPVALTGTLSIGAAMEGLVRHALQDNPEIGGSAGTVNAVVAECSDARLSDIRALAVRPRHVLEAIAAAAGGPVAEGSVGAGTGMVCYGWKGGIGTASRHVGEAAGGFTVGALVLANFGRGRDLRIAGVPVGERLLRRDDPGGGGSCVVVLATDAPADHRQLGRLARRAQYGLGRTGTYGDHGSGEYAIAFSTASHIPHTPPSVVIQAQMLAEDGPVINALFQAVTESVEEAVVNALLRARSAGPAADAIAPPIDPAAVAAIVAGERRAG